jgi:hypothetical protein
MSECVCRDAPRSCKLSAAQQIRSLFHTGRWLAGRRRGPSTAPLTALLRQRSVHATAGRAAAQSPPSCDCPARAPAAAAAATLANAGGRRGHLGRAVTLSALPPRGNKQPSTLYTAAADPTSALSVDFTIGAPSGGLPQVYTCNGGEMNLTLTAAAPLDGSGVAPGSKFASTGLWKWVRRRQQVLSAARRAPPVVPSSRAARLESAYPAASVRKRARAPAPTHPGGLLIVADAPPPPDGPRRAPSVRAEPASLTHLQSHNDRLPRCPLPTAPPIVMIFLVSLCHYCPQVPRPRLALPVPPLAVRGALDSPLPPVLQHHRGHAVRRERRAVGRRGRGSTGACPRRACRRPWD